MAEGGLGFNNLLYMAVLLAALADRPDEESLRILLVEEPEAHLHPQLQDLLMRFLEERGRERDTGHRDYALAELRVGGARRAPDGDVVCSRRGRTDRPSPDATSA